MQTSITAIYDACVYINLPCNLSYIKLKDQKLSELIIKLFLFALTIMSYENF